MAELGTDWIPSHTCFSRTVYTTLFCRRRWALAHAAVVNALLAHALRPRSGVRTSRALSPAVVQRPMRFALALVNCRLRRTNCHRPTAAYLHSSDSALRDYWRSASLFAWRDCAFITGSKARSRFA